MKRNATCLELSRNLGNDNSLYCLVLTNVSDGELTFHYMK